MRKVVLVGGGHAHVYILKQLQKNKWTNAHVVLISPNRYQYYSGMFSGYLEGRYETEEIRIDLARLCAAASVRFVEASVVSVDPGQQELVTSTGQRLDYDVISFDIGSHIANTDIPGVLDHATFIKPNYLIPSLKDVFLTKERLVVAGGGASGIEIALSLQARRKRLGFKQSVTLISKGPLLEHASRQVTRHMTEIVHKKGIHLIQHDPVVSVCKDHLELQSGKTVSYDQLIWLTGPAAPPLFQKSGFPTDSQGYMLVNHCLQCVTYENVFGAGDCISIKPYPWLHKAGVYAVREAPVLWTNLGRYLSGTALKPYIPQSDYLSILSTGDGEAFLLYRGLSFHGGWCWRLKHAIDTSFMKKYKG
jgi:pyridine nucleotide-disulfide oxidoreductase family protein